MKIYTGYFAMTREYEKAGLTMISIDPTYPFWNRDNYHRLAVPGGVRKLKGSRFEQEYNYILNRLSPTNVVRELKEISRGKDVILMSSESPEKTSNRRIVAKWLSRYGFPVEEFKVDPIDRKNVQTSLF